MQEIKQRKAHDEHNTMQQVASSDAETHENENIAKALKVEWISLNQEYLKLPVLIDTPSKKARKEEYERRLDVIERKIMLSQ